MRFGRLEFGSAAIFSLLPSPFVHRDVFFDDEVFADEYGVFWLGQRVSLYLGTRSYSQVRARKRDGR